MIPTNSHKPFYHSAEVAECKTEFLTLDDDVMSICNLRFDSKSPESRSRCDKTSLSLGGAYQSRDAP